MPSGGVDPRRPPVDIALPMRLLKLAASCAAALLVIALLSLIFAPKNPETLTLYGLVIGVNLLLLLVFWPAAKWLQRLDR